MSDALVIITGASRGIGRAVADAVPFPARVLDVSRSGADGLEHITADLATPQGWTALGGALRREFDGFEGDRAVLVHCAGTLTPIGFVGEVDDELYAANVMLNSAAGQVIGHHFLAATAHLDCRRELVMISSGAASSVYPGWSAYCAGKAALDHWVRVTGREQAQRAGALVVAIAPGVVATEMQAEIRAQDPEDFPAVERFRQLHDDGELRDPDEVARELWQVLDRGPDNGAVLDLRDLELG